MNAAVGEEHAARGRKHCDLGNEEPLHGSNLDVVTGSSGPKWVYGSIDKLNALG